MAEGTQEPGTLCITFELRRVMYIGASAQEHIQLRVDYLQQCFQLSILPEALQGEACELTAEWAKKYEIASRWELREGCRFEQLQQWISSQPVAQSLTQVCRIMFMALLTCASCF